MSKTFNELLFEQASPDKVMPIAYLWRAVCRWFYDEKHCPPTFRLEFEKEIIKWNKILSFQDKIRFESTGQHAIGQEGNIIDELNKQIGRMSQWIRYKDLKIWESPECPPMSPDAVRIHNLDYRKILDCQKWFPELKIDFKKGKGALKKAQEDNPEDYVNGN